MVDSKPEHSTSGSEDLPEPAGWSIIDRSPVAVVWEHDDGTEASTIPDGPSKCTFEIDGDELFEVTDRRSDESRLWEMVEAALVGWPDNVEACRTVGNTGLGDFGGSD